MAVHNASEFELIYNYSPLFVKFCKIMFDIFFPHLSHFGEGLPRLAYSGWNTGPKTSRVLFNNLYHLCYRNTRNIIMLLLWVFGLISACTALEGPNVCIKNERLVVCLLASRFPAMLSCPSSFLERVGYRF
jgi:hypothetical protein